MKKFTRIICVVLCMVMAMSLPMGVSADSYTNADTTKKLELEYMEFYNNQEYYKALARNEGYTLIISVGEEYEALETARLKAEAQEIDELIPGNKTRGTTVPTSKYNVAKKQYTISGHSVQSTLYTQKKVYGAINYEMSIHNKYSATSGLTLKVTTDGFIQSGDMYFFVDPGKTVLKYGSTHHTSDLVYLAFRAPVSVDGYIKNAG